MPPDDTPLPDPTSAEPARRTFVDDMGDTYQRIVADEFASFDEVDSTSVPAHSDDPE